MSKDAKVGMGCMLGVFGVAASSLFYILFYILLFKILERIDATPEMWTLYWIWVPVAILVSCVAQMVKTVLED